MGGYTLTANSRQPTKEYEPDRAARKLISSQLRAQAESHKEKTIDDAGQDEAQVHHANSFRKGTFGLKYGGIPYGRKPTAESRQKNTKQTVRHESTKRGPPGQLL